MARRFPRALGHFTAIRDAVEDRPQSRALADSLGGRSVTLSNLGRLAEAAEDGRRSLELARELGYPAGEALALADLSIAAHYIGDLDNSVRLARQAEQIPADIPGWIARLCTYVLALVLIASGDLAAAERSCAAGLARSRDTGDLRNYTRLLVLMAWLDLQAGRTEDAQLHLHESLETAVRTGGWVHVVHGLVCCGYLCAATGRATEAATVWAAAVTLAPQGGFTDTPAYARRRQQLLREARRALGPDRARVAEQRGAVMSLAAAAEYALMLTAPSTQQAPPELAKLSSRERELVTLVAQGPTNAQIAAQLYISVRTVGSHLDRIRDKTGCRRRADLTRLALSEGFV